MKKNILLLILLLITTAIFAQEMEVKSMEALTMDTYASVHRRLDKNDAACAVVRVSLPADGATFSGTNSIGSIERIGADYIVFMPASSKKMYIQHPYFHELEIVFNDYGFKTLQSLATYRITINAPQANATQKKQTLNIKVTPKDAIVQIDGETVEESSISLTVGTHKYNVAAKGYHSQDGAIEVKESSPAKLLVELDKKVSQSASQQISVAPTTTSATLSNVNSVHEYVDLGLSVKWATCNVGATKPEDYGEYYAWGETTPKSAYSWSTYFDSVGGSNKNFTKYATNKKTNLDAEDDAVHVNWGGSWRIPTDAELTELRTKCTWTWTTQKGVQGYKVTGTNGNSIFLPVAGCRNNSALSSAGSNGSYWSSSLSGGECAYSVCFGLDGVHRYGSDRYYGRSLRAVCP